MSIYQSSTVSSGYSSAAILWAMREKSPSVFFIIFAFVTQQTRVLPFFLAKSNAARAIRAVPSDVVTLKSHESSPGTDTPRLPSTYSPSVFSRKKVQSIPSAGIDTGRTFANRSSSRLMATLALSSSFAPVPPCGVVVGPLRTTLHPRIAASTSSGIALPAASRFSMVSPSISRSSTLPAAISSARSASSTRRASAVIIGPMPAPPQQPITILSSTA